MHAGRKIITVWYEDIFSGLFSADLGPRRCDELFSPSYVRHAPPGPEIRGPTEAEHLCALIRAAFPDVPYTLEDLVAEGDAGFFLVSCDRRLMS
jgi:hypothetical protein